MQAALARLRAELAALDADVALVTVVGEDGERDVLTPRDCNAPPPCVTDDCANDASCCDEALPNKEEDATHGRKEIGCTDATGLPESRCLVNG